MNRLFYRLRTLIKPLFITLAIIMSSQVLTACTPVLIGAATVTGVDLYLERRTVKRNIDDNALEVKLRKDYIREDQFNGTNISVTAINGIVLLTGEVLKDEQRKNAESIAREYIDTREVVNELELSGKTNLNSRANDSYITGKIKTALLRAENVPSTNIKVVTERSKVYLLGLVTHPEADAAVKAAQSVTGVTHIVKVFEYIDG